MTPKTNKEIELYYELLGMGANSMILDAMDEKDSVTEVYERAVADPNFFAGLTMDYQEDNGTRFPNFEYEYFEDQEPPALKPELLQGILRKGGKMLLVGDSKAKKSFCLIELAVCIAEGAKWLNAIQCTQGDVLYVNFEIDPAEFHDRLCKVRDALNVGHNNKVTVWNLKGYAMPLDKFVPVLIDEVKKSGKQYAAVILDPIYKIQMGDENNATDMGRFCNQLDKICKSLDTSVIYCHHHSKGEQNYKKSMDRASGSGVFARDADALLDITELAVPADMADGRTAYRMDFTVRSFPDPAQLNFWFDYPIHYYDADDVLDDCITVEEEKRNSGNNTKKRIASYNLSLNQSRILESFKKLASYGKRVTRAMIADDLGENKDWVKNHMPPELGYKDPSDSSKGILSLIEVVDGTL